MTIAYVPNRVRRVRAALLAALVLLPAAPVLAQPAGAPDLAAVDAPRLDVARARLGALEAESDAVSAELARVRGGLSVAGPEDRDLLAAEERRLQARKEALGPRLDAAREAVDRETEAAVRLAEREQDGGGATAGATGDSPTGVVLAPGTLALAGDDGTTTTTPTGATAPPATGTPVTLPTGAGADAARIDGYLASRLSPLAGLGPVFVAEAGRVGLDPRLLVAISGAETSFGTYGPSQAIRNPFGLGPGMAFPSWADAIRYAAGNLGGRLYRGDGRVTIPAISTRWAPVGATNDPTGLNGNWTRNVSLYYAQLGGDPGGPVFTGVAAVPVAAVPVAVAAPVTPPDAGPRAAAEALRLLGAPHPREAGRDGLDAGGLVQVAYARQGVTVPATPAALAGVGAPVEPLALRAGDVVLFAGEGGAVTHAGLYLGAGQFVHAPGPGGVVSLASLYDAPWSSAYAGARRP